MCFRHFLGKHVAKKTRPPLKTSGPQAVNSEPSLKLVWDFLIFLVLLTN